MICHSTLCGAVPLKKTADGAQVKWDEHELPVDEVRHLVRVRMPRREAQNNISHWRYVHMEDMRVVLVNVTT